MPNAIAIVSKYPKCQIHPVLHPDQPAPDARYDFKTKKGYWALGCVTCWRTMRPSTLPGQSPLGVGRGQRLVLERTADPDPADPELDDQPLTINEETGEKEF